MVTHEPRYAAWADRVVFLRDGSIVDQTLTTGADSLLSAGIAGTAGTTEAAT
jgi:putative ABC transport system ATP-binding protein